MNAFFVSETQGYGDLCSFGQKRADDDDGEMTLNMFYQYTYYTTVQDKSYNSELHGVKPVRQALTSRSVAMSKMSILGGQTRRKSSRLVMTPASSTQSRLQRSARIRYTETSPVQLMSPRPAVCQDQSG